nr:venom protein [Lampona murina]
MKYILIVITIIGTLNCDPISEDGSSHPRLLSDLPELLDSEEGIEELYEEFQSIPGGQRRPWTVAELPQNIKKNRYEDELLAYDHSRVVLKTLPDDPDSDYINANFIDGSNSEREYIATQGPLPNTIGDFWRMVVQQNATRIIMLANLVEHGKVKVSKYWPDTNGTYGQCEIVKIQESSIPRLDIVIRTFSIKRPGIDRPHIVRHFHFTGWPDLGVPTDRFPIIAILKLARLYDPESKSPLVVHCSAGIGRTGTLILTDSMIKKVHEQDEAREDGEDVIVDFQKRLDHMRTLRPDVVEKKEQYVFAHQAVNDVFNVPETQDKLKELKEEYYKLDEQE